MSSLSTHVLDIELGAPAAGLAVALYQDDRCLAQAVTDSNGRIANLGAGDLNEGVYCLVFDVAAYLLAQGRAAPFLRRVSVEFGLAAVQAHYHVPLLMTAYACSTYRGS